MTIKKKKKEILTVEDIVADIKRGHKWTGNILQKMAEEMFRYSLPVDEVLKNDLSVTLLKELDRQVKNREIISLQINAKPRMAKSTLGLHLGKFVFGLLLKYGMKKDGEFSMKNVARDQGERAKIMRDPERMHDIVVTDESNALEDTGENSTVEKAQREVFSDVQAGRYMHGIFICPDGTMDKNTDIKLEIRNRANGLVHTRVYYYMRSSMYYGWVMIGIADFDVKKLIKQWLIVEPRFFEYLKEKRDVDRKYIDYWRKRDFYVQYMVKKYEKMELMNREGIMHARDLDYATIRKNVIDALKPLAKLPFISVTKLKSNVKTRVGIEFKKRSMPLSMVGQELEAERIMGYLNMYRSGVEIESQMKSILKQFRANKISDSEYNKTMTILSDARDEILIEIKANEDDLKRLAILQEKYNEFEKD